MAYVSCSGYFEHLLYITWGAKKREKSEQHPDFSPKYITKLRVRPIIRTKGRIGVSNKKKSYSAVASGATASSVFVSASPAPPVVVVVVSTFFSSAGVQPREKQPRQATIRLKATKFFIFHQLVLLVNGKSEGWMYHAITRN